NTFIDVKQKDGTPVFGPDLATFFSSLNPGFLGDPKVLYDQYSNQFVFICLDLTFGVGFNDPTNVSRFLIATSKTDTPTDATSASWNFTAINNKTFVGGNDYWLDYPRFGLDSKALYITGNLFGFDGFSTNGTRLFIINKATMAAKEYNPAQVAGIPVPNQSSTLQPAHIYGATPGNIGTWLITWVNPTG